MNNNKRKDHEPPPATLKGMKFHHIGILTQEKRPNEKYIEHLKFYVSGFDSDMELNGCVSKMIVR